MKKVIVFILSILSGIVIISFILFNIYGERIVWKMILPDDEDLIGDYKIPKTLTPEILNGDLIYLSEELLKRTPYAAKLIDTTEFQKKSDSLIKELKLKGKSHVLELFKLISLPMESNIGSGHTKIPLVQRPLNWEFYPFYAYMFDDGLWIIKAGDSYSDIAGKQILKINQVSVEKVYSQARPFISADNEMRRLYEFSSYLNYSEFLRQLGVVPEDGILELTVKDLDGNMQNVKIESAELFSRTGLRWGEKIRQNVDTWCPADPRPRSKNYRFNYLEDKKAIYFQFNRVQNQEDESIKEFTDRLSDFVQNHPVDRFIVDIRSNGGGNNQLFEPLIELISGNPKINRQGNLYTLIGRRTFSAAGAFATALELRTKTLFVGEKSGFNPDHIGDAVKIALPKSRILVNISSRFWQNGGPYDTRDGIDPDIRVPLSFTDYLNNNDPALQASLSHKVPGDTGTDLSDTEIQNLRMKIAGKYEYDPLRTIEISSDSGGFASFHITYIDDWADSKIYLPASKDEPFGTDIKNVYLEIDDKDQLVMDWKGVQKTLNPLKENNKNAIGELTLITKDPTISVKGVSQLFRDLHNRGTIFDSSIEFLLNNTGYWLLNNERPEDAVEIFQLQTELFPVVANGFDSMGDAYSALSEHEKATDAYKTALELDPGFTHARKMLDKAAK